MEVRATIDFGQAQGEMSHLFDSAVVSGWENVPYNIVHAIILLLIDQQEHKEHRFGDKFQIVQGLKGYKVSLRASNSNVRKRGIEHDTIQ